MIVVCLSKTNDLRHKKRASDKLLAFFIFVEYKWVFVQNKGNSRVKCKPIRKLILKISKKSVNQFVNQIVNKKRG